MNFLIDAQLPRRLARRLREIGHDTLHTLDLLVGNRTPDRDINAISLHQARVVLVSTGNITNADLEALFLSNVPAIVEALQTYSYVELTRTALIVHG